MNSFLGLANIESTQNKEAHLSPTVSAPAANPGGTIGQDTGAATVSGSAANSGGTIGQDTGAAIVSRSAANPGGTIGQDTGA
jgi:hypothetical protein